jgi:hypothetical protein
MITNLVLIFTIVGLIVYALIILAIANFAGTNEYHEDDDYYEWDDDDET